MRVALVIYGTLDTVSGGYLYDRQLVAHLQKRGDVVDIISLPWRAYSHHLTDNLSADLRRRMECGGYDLILQDELNHPSLAWANGRLPPGRPPLVSIVHHLRSSEARPAWQNRLFRVVERRYLRSVDAFIYNSHTTRRVAEGLIGRRMPHIVAHPGGDRLAAFHPRQVAQRPNDGPLRLLFVGNLIPRKGLHTLLAALARVSGDWRLRVVGGDAADPGYASDTRRLAEQLNINGRVAWLGPLPDEELAAEMAAADVLAVPSDYEGFGIVYLEGMGFGLPALATTAGAAAETIADGVNGFLVAPGDATALAMRIEALAADRALLSRMSAAALQRFRGHPTWDEMAAAVRGFLLQVIEQSETP